MNHTQYFQTGFFKFISIFLRDFSTVFRLFLREFSIFSKDGLSTEIPIKRDGLLCIKVCAQCLKCKANDDYYWKNGTKRKKVQIRNCLLNYFIKLLSVLGSNYDLYGLQSN